jgi:hypothetical protein
VKFVFLDLVLGIENENPKSSIQEEYRPLHAPLEGNFDLLCTQFESNGYNDFKDEFKEPPLGVH